MITRSIDLKVKDNTSTLKEKIYLWHGDYNICYKIKPIIKYQISEDAIAGDFAGGKAEVVFLKPNGTDKIEKKMDIENEYVKVIIDKEMADEMEECGIWKVQIRLMNEDESSRFTIPPFDIEVLSLISD